jgi:aldehyde:ferredoxin oxidoreductase
MEGFFNKIVRINLKTKTFKEETIPDSVYETYLGGKGLGIYLLMKENPPGVDPLSPKNKLIFCIGPITDTRIYGSCRHGVFTKSPLTGIFSEPYSGGKIAEPMSRTGYDAFIFEESSNNPVWIKISDQFILDKGKWMPFPLNRIINIIERVKKKGLIIKAMGQALEFAPPLIIRKEEIDEAIKILDECMTEEEKEMGLL